MPEDERRWPWWKVAYFVFMGVLIVLGILLVTLVTLVLVTEQNLFF